MLDPAEIPVEVQNWIGRQLFDHVPTNVIVVDRQFRVVAANSKFVDVFGDTKGKHCYEVYKRRTSVCDECMADKTFEDGQVRVRDETGVDRNGRPSHYVVHISPVYNEIGEITHVIELSLDVTKSRHLQREYNLLFERVPCFVAVINREFEIVRANELMRRTFGDHRGRHCYEAYKNRTSRCKNCPAVKTLKDGNSHTSHQVGVNRKGEPTNYVVSTAPLTRDGKSVEHIIEMSLDVTENRRLAQNLYHEHQFMEKITQGAMDALVAFDADWKISVFNPAAEALFKIPASRARGSKDVSRYMPESFLSLVKEGSDALTLPETMVTDNEGQKIPVRFSGTVLRDGKRVLGVAAFLQDLREYKKLEQEKLENERLAAVGQTVAQLAHGIKNILTGLRGGMYVIKSGIKRGSTERTERGWEMLDRNMNRITELVKGFLGFAKGHQPNAVPTQLASLANAVRELYAAGAAESGITIEVDAQPGMADACVDPEDIRTCLENLVSNALDACQVSERPEKRVTIGVSEEASPAAIVIEVSDTGVGMDCQIKNKVFTTFFTTKGLGGTGLGLMVTRKIVQAHGGRISLQSRPGEGSVFRIVLPRGRLPSPPVHSE